MFAIKFFNCDHDSQSIIWFPLLTFQAKLTKLVNFLYVRRHSTNLRAAAHLVAALKAFAQGQIIVSCFTPTEIF